MVEQHHDVLIVGAGLAGIGFAYHLQTSCPERSFAIYEARDKMGGTWDLFRYPGIRSDVNMHLYGFGFEAWDRGACIASGSEILDYLKRTARKHGLDKKMRFNRRMVSADWVSDAEHWRVVFQGYDGEEIVTANWLQICTGYFSYKEGHTVDFPGQDTFQGSIVHPQSWPEDLDFGGKEVVIIGSGATTVTLAPSLADQSGHVTVLQRSPSYVYASDSRDYIGEFLERHLPQGLAFPIIRFKNLWLDRLRWWITTTRPERIVAKMDEEAAARLPPAFEYEKHFKPSYPPSEQRVCFSPDGDYFEAISTGKVSVLTDTVARFLPDGIETGGGNTLPADIVVTATGLKMVIAGEAQLSVDGVPIRYPETLLYRGTMLAGVPNCSFTIGTFVAPYTLRVELIAKWVCRLIATMDKKGWRVAVAEMPDGLSQGELKDFAEDFSSGYIRRAAPHFPRQGTSHPWLNVQDYGDNKKVLSERIDDGLLSLR